MELRKQVAWCVLNLLLEEQNSVDLNKAVTPTPCGLLSAHCQAFYVTRTPVEDPVAMRAAASWDAVI